MDMDIEEAREYAPNYILELAARENNETVIDFCIKNGANEFSDAIITAAGNGYVNLIEKFIKLGEENAKYCTYEAAFKRKMESLTKLEELGCVDFNAGLRGAGGSGDIHILRYCIERGATDYAGAIESAAYYNNMNIIQELKNRTVADLVEFNKGMLAAAKAGNVNIAEFCAENGATNFDEAMLEAAKKGHISIVEFCAENGATNFIEVLLTAARYNHQNGEEVVKFCAKNGANKYRTIMKQAERDYPKHIARNIKSWISIEQT